jgi:hypothetical protein
VLAIGTMPPSEMLDGLRVRLDGPPGPDREVRLYYRARSDEGPPDAWTALEPPLRATPGELQLDRSAFGTEPDETIELGAELSVSASGANGTLRLAIRTGGHRS